MKRWTIAVLTVGLVCVSAGVLLAAAGVQKPGGRLRRVWGRVEDVSTKKNLIAVKYETEEKGETTEVFLITEDTKIRKEEKVKKLSDIKKGMEVIVFYRPKTGDDKYATALGIRIRDDHTRRPGKRLRP